jgi:hypothetical protein
MFDYLAFIHAGIPEASSDARTDGINLAKKCLKDLNAVGNKERFPPSLLILLASPAYLQKQKAKQLLKGINDTFGETVGEVDLIGSSVGGVFFDQRVHPNGALLICLASTLIEARVAFGTNARLNPQNAIDELLESLELDPSKQIDPNPLANRLIITFMPGCNRTARNGAIFPAPELHRLLYEGVQERIWMIGGVSSANLRSLKKDGFQFAKRQVLKDSVVAASIITGVPIGVSLNDGLERTNKVLRVTKLARDKRTVLEFDGKSPRPQLDNGNLMLAKLSADDERTVDIPLPLQDGSVQMLRPLKRNDYFQVFLPTSKIAQKALSGIEQAKRRVYVERPVATLLFPCNAYNPRTEMGIANAESALTEIEKSLQKKSNQVKPCVGGFFDGEIGVDAHGRSRLTNGGVGYLIFGDEIRERTPLYKGVSALAAYGHKLLAGSELNTAAIYATIRNALEIISETGFPGAMISLNYSNLDRGLRHSEKKRFIIACEAVGARFIKIKDLTKRRLEGKDVLAMVAREKQPRFIPDSRKDRACDKTAINESGIISQYILPLKRLDDSSFGTLQVDLGDLSSLSHNAFSKTEKARMLNCFAEVFSASINRIANAVENNIKLELDKALESSLAANSFHAGVHNFFTAAGKALGVEMGHLRLVHTTEGEKAKQRLVLETGFGACYEAEKSKRHEISADEFSPICCAFRSKEPHVVNEVHTDPAFQAMLKRAAHDRELQKALSQAQSYAAVGFKNEQGKQLGAVSFGSTQPWFFLELHRAALEALAERLGFLVEHLKTKIARNFLLAVSPKLAKRNLNDAERIFHSIANDFRSALNAEISSLYLWDEDTKKYVLRAQSNWNNNGWVHAAKYDENSRWIGITAVNEEPLYVPDLRKYYLEHQYDFPHGRYAEYMFGQLLSNSFAVEAIGLPLRIGADKKDKFGVLTLYRHIKPGQRTGFVTTDIRLLQEGAYNAAGLVNAVLWDRANKWEKQEEKRRNRLYQGLSSSEVGPFEAKICLEVLKTYGAAEVDFYRIDRVGRKLIHSWIAGYRSRPRQKKTEKLVIRSSDHREILADAGGTEDRKQAYRVASRRRVLTDDETRNPQMVKTEGLVEQVCVPLIGDRKHLASLVIRWRIGPGSSFSLASRHNDFHLQVLGRILGSAYSKGRIKKRAERSSQAVQTAGLYVFQHAHKLVNAIQDLYRLAQSVRSAADEHTRKTNIRDLETTAEGYIDKLNWVFDLGETIQNPAKEAIPLSSFIEECWQELAGGTELIDGVDFPDAEELIVRADPKLIKEVFFNLMNNAISATKQQKKKTGVKTHLSITAALSEDLDTVRVVFADNGIGMTRKQKEDAYRGFRPTGQQFRNVKHKGVGVLISRFLLGVQDGDLDHISKRGNGTKAIVTLPNFRSKGEKRWNGDH